MTILILIIIAAVIAAAWYVRKLAKSKPIPPQVSVPQPVVAAPAAPAGPEAPKAQ